MSHSSNPRQFIFPGVHLALSGFPGELKSTAILIWLPWEFPRSRYNLFLQPLHSLPAPRSLPSQGCSLGPPSSPRPGPQLCPLGRHPLPRYPGGKAGDGGGEGTGRREERGGGAAQGGGRAPPRSQRGAAEGCICWKEAFGCLVTGCQNGERGREQGSSFLTSGLSQGIAPAAPGRPTGGPANGGRRARGKAPSGA